MEVIVDFWNVDTGKLDTARWAIDPNVDLAFQIEQGIGAKHPIDAVYIYPDEYGRMNPQHIEFPYSSRQILDGLFIDMATNNSVMKEELDYMRKQIENFHNDEYVDKEFIAKMIVKYEDFD